MCGLTTQARQTISTTLSRNAFNCFSAVSPCCFWLSRNWVKVKVTVWSTLTSEIAASPSPSPLALLDAASQRARTWRRHPIKISLLLNSVRCSTTLCGERDVAHRLKWCKKLVEGATQAQALGSGLRPRRSGLQRYK